MDRGLGRRVPVIGILVVALALIPVFLVLLRATVDAPPLLVIGRTLVQATFSAVLSIILAFPLAWALGENWIISRILRPLTLLPVVLSPLVMILVATSLFGNSGLLPIPTVLYSFWGVVIVHSLYNFPLAARLLHGGIATWQGYSDISKVMSADFPTRITKIWIPLLKPTIVSVFSVIFLYSFTSFSIPLIFGGTTTTTLETEIYLSFFSKLDFGKAAYFSILQLLFLAPIVFFLRSEIGLFTRPRYEQKNSLNRRLIATFYGAYFLIVFLLIASKISIADISLTPIINSLVIAVLAATSALSLFAIIPSFVRKMSYLFLAISPATLALAYVGFSGNWLLVVVLHALMGLYMFQMVLGPKLEEVSAQMHIASVLGANRLQSLITVALPLLRKNILLAWILAVFVSISEVALVNVVSGGTFDTISSHMLASFSHYRFGEGVFYSLFLMCTSMIAVFAMEWFNDA